MAGEISAATAWRAEAACTDKADLFLASMDLPLHGGKLTSADRALVRRCKAVCEPCEVKSECLKAAIRHEDVWGVHGGLAPHQKAALVRQAAKTAKASA